VETIASSNAHGVSAAYTYDDAGRLSTVVDNRLSANNTTTYSYDAASNVRQAVYPNSPNNAPSTYTYDTLNRLTALSTPVSSYAYTLGPTGNRTAATEGNGRTLAWSYDGIYRLTNESVSADPDNVNGSVGYVLDAVGNRKSATSTLSGVNSSGTFTYNSDDELMPGEGDTYDNGGNTLSTSFPRGMAPGFRARNLPTRSGPTPFSDTLVLRTLPPLPRIHQERSASGFTVSP